MSNSKNGPTELSTEDLDLVQGGKGEYARQPGKGDIILAEEMESMLHDPKKPGVVLSSESETTYLKKR